MRAPFMAGIFPFPVKYGYSTVGRIEAGPEALIGRNVFALHPHQNLFDVPASAGAGAGGDQAVARRDGRQHGNRAQRHVGRGAGPFGRIAVVGAGVVGALVAFSARGSKGRGDAGRYRSGARANWPRRWG
jgi:hypothetical protein